MIFRARHIQEKCREQHQDIFTVFIDLTKAFDSVSRPGLWMILAKIGCPQKFINLIRSFHDGMMGQVIDGGEASTAFAITNRTKQGCVLAALLFSIFFAMMLLVAFKDCDSGIPVRFRADGNVFNLCRLQARTKTFVAMIRDCCMPTIAPCSLYRRTGQFFYRGTEPSLPENFSTVPQKTAMLTCKIT